MILLLRNANKIFVMIWSKDDRVHSHSWFALCLHVCGKINHIRYQNYSELLCRRLTPFKHIVHKGFNWKALVDFVKDNKSCYWRVIFFGFWRKKSCQRLFWSFLLSSIKMLQNFIINSFYIGVIQTVYVQNLKLFLILIQKS